MFLSAILFASTFLSLTRADCTFEDNSYGNEISISYICSELIITLGYTNGTDNGRLSVGPANYEECAVVSVDKLSKLDVKGGSSVDFLELSISNVELEQKRSYSEVMSKFGIGPSNIRTVSVYDCPNLTLAQLKGFDELWSLDISSSLQSDSTTAGQDLGKMFPKLRTLRLESNQLKQGPSLVGLKFLEEITLNFNGIEELSDKYFADNTMLTQIDISELEIKKLPSNICQGLDNLESLNLYVGQASFPVLGNCPELRQIYVQKSFDEANNDTSSASPTGLFPDMPKLSSVMLGNVALKKVTKETFAKNSQLTSLSLSFSDIVDVSDDAFLDLLRLTDLDLAYNNISKISDAILPPSIERFSASGTLVSQYKISKSLPKLGYLELSGAQLSDNFLFENVPKSYPLLQSLNLQGNQLVRFNISGSLDFVHGNDVEIDLSANQIQTVTVSDMPSSDKGSSRIKLDLSNNRLKCDCGLKSFIEALRQKNARVRLAKDVSCESPKGETLKTIDLGKMKC